MVEEHARSPLRRYNLLATFSNEAEAEAAVAQLHGLGLSGDQISLRPSSDAPAVAEAEMRDEIEGSVLAELTVGVLKDQQGPQVDAPDPGRVVGVHLEEDSAMSAAEAVLKVANPLRIDRIAPGGEVLSTQSMNLDTVPVEPGSGRVANIDEP